VYIELDIEKSGYSSERKTGIVPVNVVWFFSSVEIKMDILVVCESVMY